MDQIKNDELLLKWFKFGFKRLTKTKFIDDIDTMYWYLKSHFSFDESMMLALANARHYINSMCLYINGRSITIYD